MDWMHCVTEQQARLHSSKGMPGCMHGCGLSLGVQWGFWEQWEHSYSVAAWVTCASPLSLQTCLITVHMTRQDHISIHIPCQDLDLGV